EMWALYRAALAKAQADPADKPARCAVAAYLSAWTGLSAKLGLMPADRARLQAMGLWSEPKTPSAAEWYFFGPLEGREQARREIEAEEESLSDFARRRDGRVTAAEQLAPDDDGDDAG